jgi:predicted Fe-Mo cluster-binding NifX family protein
MRLALPDWQGRISPVFDVAREVVLVDLDSGNRQRASLGSLAPHDRAARLVEWGVDVLVCGAISWPLESLLIASGMQVISLVCGDVDDVVRAFREGALEREQFAMPGCCRVQQRNRHRRRRRGGGPARRDRS